MKPCPFKTASHQPLIKPVLPACAALTEIAADVLPQASHDVMAMNEKSRPRVVIVGGGFGGLKAAEALARLPVQITLVDRSNHHTFQPLLYQVATAGISPAEIAAPIREILRKHENVEVLLGEILSFDLQ